MLATSGQIEALQGLQQADIEIIRARKEYDALPQRMQIATLRKKRTAIQGKRDQAGALDEKVSSDLSKVETEDADLQMKAERVQALIDEAGDDFRSIETHSKEMAGFAKRRETLTEKHAKLSDELAKIQSVVKQLDDALAIIDAQDKKATAELTAHAATLNERMGEIAIRREKFAVLVPDDLLRAYKRAAGNGGGVGFGRLDGETCGVCRSLIEGGRLIELRAAAPIGQCPHCKRLLLIEQD